MAPKAEGSGSPNQFAPPKSHVADVQDEGTVEKADRNKRLAAVMLDGVIFLILSLPALISLWPALMASEAQGKGRAAMAASLSAAMGVWVGLTSLLIVGLLLVTAYLVHQNGQTIGKKIMRIKVVRTDGSRASLGRIFWLRNFVSSLPGAIPFVGNFWGLIDALMIFRDSKKCLHDNIADTIVINA